MKIRTKFNALLAAGLLLPGWACALHAGTINEGLVAHLKFDNNYNDSSGRGNNGTPVGAPTFAAGKIGSGALVFTTLRDGSRFDYVTLGQPADLMFADTIDFSFSFWVNYTNQLDDPAYICNKDWMSGGNVGYVICAQGDGRFKWNYRGDGGGPRKDFKPNNIIRDGSWHHIAVAFVRAGNASTYVDGAWVGDLPIGDSIGSIDSGLDVNIGQDGTGGYTDGGAAEIVNGMIDDVAIWARALDANEVSRIYNAGLGGVSASEVPDVKGPFITSTVPTADAVGVGPGAVVTVTIQDGTTSVKAGSVQLEFDGAAVTPQVETAAGVTTVTYDPPGLLAAKSVHTFKITFSDTSTPPVVTSATNSFTVGDYVEIKLPAPLYAENFDGVEEAQLPAGWTVKNYTDSLTPGEDLDDPLSDSYLNWVVITRDRVNAIGQLNRWEAARRLAVAPLQVVNGQEITSLVNGKFCYAESDQRNLNQVQYLFSPDFDLSGKTDIYISYHSIYEQNQDSIGAVEYSTDQGQTWKPVVYMIDQVDIIRTGAGDVDAEATLNEPRGDTAFYTDPDTGEQKGGTYGAFVAAPITADLAPFISGRVNDDPVESKRVELFRLPAADNQANVRLRFAQAGTASWYFGIDNFGVYSIPSIAPPGVAKPADQVAAVGNSATFTTSVTGAGPFTYQWRFNGVDIADATNATLTITYVKKSDAGNYSLRVTNAGGSTESDPGVLTVLEPRTPVVTGQWDFDQGDLRATVGTAMEYFNAEMETGTRFGTTTSFGIPDIAGQVANVIEVPAPTPCGYIMHHGAAANGGGVYVNQYTLICDILFPPASANTWLAFWQTNDRNANDGDFFANPSGGIGISGNYQGAMVPDTWYRVVFAVDLSGPGPAPVVAKFINGVKVGQQTLGAGKDGRWALYVAGGTPDFAILFGDEDGESALMYANSVQFRDGRMSDADVVALGVPTAAGIPLPPTEMRISSIVRDGNNVTITWQAGATIKLQKTASLSNPVWEDVPDTLGAGSATQPLSGAAGFYRLVRQ